jgi:hypothetical protein
MVEPGSRRSNAITPTANRSTTSPATKPSDPTSRLPASGRSSASQVNHEIPLMPLRAGTTLRYASSRNAANKAVAPMPAATARPMNGARAKAMAPPTRPVSAISRIWAIRSASVMSSPGRRAQITPVSQTRTARMAAAIARLARWAATFSSAIRRREIAMAPSTSKLPARISPASVPDRAITDQTPKMSGIRLVTRQLRNPPSVSALIGTPVIAPIAGTAMSEATASCRLAAVG